MKLFNKLKGLFKRKEKPRKQEIKKTLVLKQSKVRKNNKKIAKKVEKLKKKLSAEARYKIWRHQCVSNFYKGLKLQRKNKRRKKSKMAKASRKRNRK